MKEVLKKIAIKKWGSLKLALWKERGEEVNFRCPICGDSKKAPFKKARFWFNVKRGVGHCFNCGWSGNFQKLLHDLKIEISSIIKVSDILHNYEEEVQESEIENPFGNLIIVPLNTKNFDYLSEKYSHRYLQAEIERFEKAKKYILSRRISLNLFFVLFKSEEDNAEIEKLYSKFFPYVFTWLYDTEYNIIGVQGRLFLDIRNRTKYFTKHIIKSATLAWGLHTLRNNEKDYVWLTEGIFDAISLRNMDYKSPVIASLSLSKIFPNTPFMEYLSSILNNKIVRLVPDNDSNKENLIRKYISNPRIEIWEVPKEYKDVNEFYIKDGDINKIKKLTLKRFIMR